MSKKIELRIFIAIGQSLAFEPMHMAFENKKLISNSDKIFHHIHLFLLPHF